MACSSTLGFLSLPWNDYRKGSVLLLLARARQRDDQGVESEGYFSSSPWKICLFFGFVLILIDYLLTVLSLRSSDIIIWTGRLSPGISPGRSWAPRGPEMLDASCCRMHAFHRRAPWDWKPGGAHGSRSLQVPFFSGRSALRLLLWAVSGCATQVYREMQQQLSDFEMLNQVRCSSSSPRWPFHRD